MKRLNALLIPLAFMVLYIASGVFIQGFVSNSVLATLLANLIIILIGFFYYNTAVCDACLPISKLSVPITGLFLIPFWFCVSLTSTYLVTIGSSLGSYAAMSPDQAALYALMSVFVAPVAEEILFRGILFRSFKKIWSLPVSCIISSMIFGVFHGTWVHFYVGILCGMLFSLVYEYTGRLGASVAVHAGYNLLTVVLSGVALPNVLFSPVVLLISNIVIISVLCAACGLIGSGIQSRTGKAVDKKESKFSIARFLRRVVPGYAGPVDLTVGLLVQCFRPETNVIILDSVGTQLYIGNINEMTTRCVSGVFSRKIKVQSSGNSLATDGQSQIVYLIFQVI